MVDSSTRETRSRSPLDTSRAAACTVGTVVIWVIVGTFAPTLLLGENQTLYIFSSQAQVVAAVFGLTITGYVFLRDQQDRLSDQDESLTEIIDSIQREQFSFIALLTGVSIASMLMSLLTIAYREHTSFSLRTGILNTATALFIASLVLTAIFVFHAMRPSKIARTSAAIKAEVEAQQVGATPPEPQFETPASAKGNLEEFLLAFNSIEQRLDEFAREHLERPRPVSGVTWSDETSRIRQPRTTWTKPRIVRAMESQGVIDKVLAARLIDLIRYRNALVHGQDMSVPDDVLGLVTSIRDELARRLMPPTPDQPADDGDV
jgi:hypothetical protein